MHADDTVNILVVDDRPDKLLALEVILADLGLNVVTALSGREALRRLLDGDFAVILLDVNMPDMDGFETAALIRQRKRSAHTPIIFVTAFSDEIQTARGYSLGAVDYILSPVVPDVLRTKVRVFADLFRMTAQIKRQAEERIALERAEAARAVAEEANRRSAFLAEASRVLANSLDVEPVLRGFAGLLVPALGDVGVVALADEEGEPQECELSWADPGGGRVTRSLGQAQGLNGVLRETVRGVLSTGRAEFWPEAPPSWSAAALRDSLAPGWDLEEGALQPRSALVLPLPARGRTLGAMALLTTRSGRRLGPADLSLAEDLAGRAAVALDNARLYRDIREADRQKNEFLSMLAHELRNPLAPIRNAVQLLQHLDPKPPQMGWVQEVIDRQVRQMVRLVDDLLDVSRITRGKIQLRPEPVGVGGVVDCAVETSRPLIDERKHRLTVAVPDDLPRVHADPARLAQVLANLLNNAAKYTDPGGRIDLAVAREGNEVVFRVRDNGPGIPREMLGRVFDLFTQVDRALDRSQGGLGIGLTLVQRLVQMHGGSVQAFSAGPKQGAEFVVRLPALDESHPIPTNPTDAAPIPEPLPPRRILLVDDNADGADSLAQVLQIDGHEVVVAHDGPAALETAATFRPEVVLLDIGLPGMTGYEVGRRLRDIPGLDKTLLVALTGYGQDEDLRRSREAGFDHHLVKPVDHEVLLNLLAPPLKERVNKRRRRRPGQEHQQAEQ